MSDMWNVTLVSCLVLSGAGCLYSAGSPAMNCSSHTRMSLDKSMSDSFESVKDGMPVVRVVDFCFLFK